MINNRRGAMGLCLLLFFCLLLNQQFVWAKDKKTRPKTDKVELRHADVVRYDQYVNPDMQIFIGNVCFYHNGLILHCDSANFFQQSNSFQAFGKVRMNQGDTLTLNSDYLFYDGNSQIVQARNRVVLKHNRSVLYTDSLNYDRVYQMGYFFEGGKLVDEGTTLTSDWGQYNTATRMATFNYHVQLNSKDMVLTSDTMHYDTNTKMAHMLGPSNLQQGTSNVYTEDGYFNTETKHSTLLNRSVIADKNQQLVADSVVYDQSRGVAEAFRNILFVDKQNKNTLTGDYCYHNDSTGFTMAYDRAVIRNYGQRDTLYLHADTFKIYTYNNKSDSVYRVIHGYKHSRSYRVDMQSVADSLSYNSSNRILSLFGNPIVWSEKRQILGEEIYAFMNDSTIDSVSVVNQALMVEQLDTIHFNQITGKEMRFLFKDGALQENRVEGNVQVIYYAFDDDSIMVGMNYTETSLARMFMKDKKAAKIWTKEATGTFYPLAFVSPEKSFLKNYAWFDYMRPKDKDDIYEWRSKTQGLELKKTVRREMPFQYLKKLK